MKFGRIGALEAENRLFCIANREQRALDLAGAFADEKLAAQRLEQPPLLGVCVLRFVDQNVVDAAVQLIKNPGRDARTLQQPVGGQDQIVVINQTAAAFGPLVNLYHGGGKTRKGGAAAGRLQKLQALHRRFETRRFLCDHTLQSRLPLERHLGRNAGAWLIFCGQKYRLMSPETRDPIGAFPGRQKLADGRRAGLLGGAAGRERLRQGQKSHAIERPLGGQLGGQTVAVGRQAKSLEGCCGHSFLAFQSL